MGANADSEDSAHRVAEIGEAFVLAWSAMPADLPERISASQLRVLLTVRGLGRPTLTELAGRLESLPSSATRLCDRLVSAGYLDRSADPDNRRFHVVQVSPSGHELLRRIDQYRAELLEGFLQRMSVRSRRQLESGLSAFAASALESRETRLPAVAAPGDVPHASALRSLSRRRA